MSETHATVQGNWCHIEIPSTDIAKGKAFYTNVFGWTFQDVPMGDKTYSLYSTPQGGMGGGLWDPPEGIPRTMINYITVDDIEAVGAAAEKNGGRIIMPQEDIPGIGSFSLIADPDGNVFGVWLQGEH